ncbi:MAG: rod shape-determining protein MreC [Acidimicrobiia bacterium]|nr:rod shape-determining protein MreC [Acidimicrobiia bacterium]
MWRPSWRPSVDRTVSLFLGLIVLSLILITVDLRASGAGVGGTARDAVQAIFTPVQRVFDAVTSPVVGFFEGISDLVGLRSENERLRDEVAELERELAETESLQVRVRELEAALGIDPPEDLESVTATVLARGVSEFDHIRLIDKGRSDGITVDMPVVDEGGLLGRVVSVTGSEARIRLISDPTMRVAVRVERTGETGVLTGRGSGVMVLEMFNTDAVLRAGDLLVTADGRFPAGIHVARVLEDAEAEVGFSLRTTAVTTAELSRIDFVRVLVFTRDDITSDDLADLEEVPVEVPVETVPESTTSTVAP